MKNKIWLGIFVLILLASASVYALNTEIIVFTVDNSEDVWQSSDGGQSWTVVNESFNGVGSDPQVMAINSSDDIFIIDGLEDVWASSDEGVTWNKIADNFNGANGNAIVMTIDSNDTLYVIDGPEDVWVSSDAGFTWNQVATNFNGGNGNVGGLVAMLNSTDNENPSVHLLNPLNGNITETGNVTFRSNATDNVGLLNTTLYHNITGNWSSNNTIWVNGTWNETNFMINSIEETMFIWNVLYCDNSSNCAFGNNNYTIYVRYSDKIAPWVNLTDPKNNNLSVTGNITFRSNATDNDGLLNATLYHNITGNWTDNETVWINGTFNDTSFIIENIANRTIFIWNVLYCDNSSNCAFGSSNWSIEVKNESDSSSGSGSSSTSTSSGGGRSGSSGRRDFEGEAPRPERYLQKERPKTEKPSVEDREKTSEIKKESETTTKEDKKKFLSPLITGMFVGGFGGISLDNLGTNIGFLLVLIAILAGIFSYILNSKKDLKRSYTPKKVIMIKKSKEKRSGNLDKLQDYVGLDFLDKIKKTKDKSGKKDISSKDFGIHFPETAKELKEKGIDYTKIRISSEKKSNFIARKAIKNETKVIKQRELKKIFPDTFKKVNLSEKNIVLKPRKPKTIPEQIKDLGHWRDSFQVSRKKVDSAVKSKIRADRKINKKANKRDILKKLEEVYDI